jgi:hypothetical protein
MFAPRYKDSPIDLLDLRAFEMANRSTRGLIEQSGAHGGVDRMAPKDKTRFNSARANLLSRQALAEMA